MSLATNHGSPSFMTTRTGLSWNLNSVGSPADFALSAISSNGITFSFSVAWRAMDRRRRAARLALRPGWIGNHFPIALRACGATARTTTGIVAVLSHLAGGRVRRAVRALRASGCTNGALVRMSVFCCLLVSRPGPAPVPRVSRPRPECVPLRLVNARSADHEFVTTSMKCA
jgi:hypothetical protein